MNSINNACCFLGHRTVCLSPKQLSQLHSIVKDLIVNKRITTFLFGSKSQFDNLCYDIASEFKTEYQNIKRIYVRSQYNEIGDEYLEYLLKSYEETYFPQIVVNAGKASYIKRNFEMINKSIFCIVYYDEHYKAKTKSGTEIAYNYAKKNNKSIINIFDI